MRSFSILIYRTFSIEFYAVRILSITFLLSVSSCQKEKSNDQPANSVKKTQQKISAWLDTKGKAHHISNDRLKNELQYSKLFQKKLNDEGKFIVIPLKENFWKRLRQIKINLIPHYK